MTRNMKISSVRWILMKTKYTAFTLLRKENAVITETETNTQSYGTRCKR